MVNLLVSRIPVQDHELAYAGTHASIHVSSRGESNGGEFSLQIAKEDSHIHVIVPGDPGARPSRRVMLLDLTATDARVCGGIQVRDLALYELELEWDGKVLRGG